MKVRVSHICFYSAWRNSSSKRELFLHDCRYELYQGTKALKTSFSGTQHFSLKAGLFFCFHTRIRPNFWPCCIWLLMVKIVSKYDEIWPKMSKLYWAFWEHYFESFTHSNITLTESNQSGNNFSMRHICFMTMISNCNLVKMKNNVNCENDNWDKFKE